MKALHKPPLDIISVSMSRTPAYYRDNSIINTRNVDTIPPTDIALHSHPFFSTIYVTDCEAFTTYVDDCELRFSPGKLYIFPPGTLHSPKNQFAGVFSTVNIKLYVNDSALAEQLGSVPFSISGNEEILKLLRIIGDFSKLTDAERNELLRDKVAELIRLILAENRSLIVNTSAEYDLKFIKVLKYMYAHCDRELDLEELSFVAHMERTAFAKKFKAMYKITPINYLYSIRLSRSLDLLMSPEIPITKIAKMVGFKRATAFSTAFVRAFGMSPTEYREILETKKFPPPDKEFKI